MTRNRRDDRDESGNLKLRKGQRVWFKSDVPSARYGKIVELDPPRHVRVETPNGEIRIGRWRIWTAFDPDVLCGER